MMILLILLLSILQAHCAKPLVLLSHYAPELYGALKKELQDQGFRVKSLENELSTRNSALFDATIIITININPHISNQIERHNLRSARRIHLYAVSLEPPHCDASPYNLLFYNKHDLIFTLDDALAHIPSMQKYVKINYPQQSLTSIPSPVPFEKRKLLTLINSYKLPSHQSPVFYHDLYYERIHVINYFRSNECFDFYGRGWDKSPFKKYDSYKGDTTNKITTLHNYKFTVCFENSCHTLGYITEKIFDAFIAGTVPIYWGAPNVTEYIPEECFIDMRKFRDLSELHQYLESLTEERHSQYIKSIKNFLNSPQAQAFLNKTVATYIVRMINLSLKSQL